MREIKTIETDRYERTENNRLRHVGMIKSQEAFDILYKHLKEVDMLPDEYFQQSYTSDTNLELPEYNSAICHTDWGGNEGIYIDIELMYIENRERKLFHFATGKTLGESGDAFLRMSRIAAECSMMLNGRGAIVRVSEQSYEHHPDHEPSSQTLTAKIESAAARTATIPQTEPPQPKTH